MTDNEGVPGGWWGGVWADPDWLFTMQEFQGNELELKSLRKATVWSVSFWKISFCGLNDSS